MPLPHTLKIAEIFPSFQGEGLRQGEPTLFIRLAGCNLDCSFCDTRQARDKGQTMTVEKILEEIQALQKTFPASWVCLTGGEPFLQNLSEITKSLKNENFKIQVETNGTVFYPLSIDWYTVSPKPKDYFFQPEYKKLAQEVKLVVSKELNLDVVQRIRQGFPAKTPLILQPQSNEKWSLEKALKMLKQALKVNMSNIRLSVQLHKIYGIK